MNVNQIDQVIKKDYKNHQWHNFIVINIDYYMKQTKLNIAETINELALNHLIINHDLIAYKNHLKTNNKYQQVLYLTEQYEKCLSIAKKCKQLTYTFNYDDYANIRKDNECYFNLFHELKLINHFIKQNLDFNFSELIEFIRDTILGVINHE